MFRVIWLALLVLVAMERVAEAVGGVFHDTTNHKLLVWGDPDPNEISVWGDADELEVFIDGTWYGPFENVWTVVANLGGDHDVFYYGDRNNVDAADQPQFVVYGGDGDDSIQTGKRGDDVYGGNGDDIIATYEGYDKIFGEGGDDTGMSGPEADYCDGGPHDEGDTLWQGGWTDYTTINWEQVHWGG